MKFKKGDKVIAYLEGTGEWETGIFLGENGIFKGIHHVLIDFSPKFIHSWEAHLPDAGVLSIDAKVVRYPSSDLLKLAKELQDPVRYEEMFNIVKSEQ